MSDARTVGVVLPAAGSGTRFGAPKHSLRIAGRPLYEVVLRTFAAHPKVAMIVLVAPAQDVEALEHEVGRFSLAVAVRVVAGGETRQRSVHHGLEALAEHPGISVALVHDVARALVSLAIIDRVIVGVERHQAAIAAVPVVDTLKFVEGSGESATIDRTLSREAVWRAQTPQGATLEALLGASRSLAGSSDPVPTDEAELLERAGIRPHIVLGAETNIKITYPEDLDRAKAFLAAGLC